jgi:hypothetical protein
MEVDCNVNDNTNHTHKYREGNHLLRQWYLI